MSWTETNAREVAQDGYTTLSSVPKSVVARAVGMIRQDLSDDPPIESQLQSLRESFCPALRDRLAFLVGARMQRAVKAALHLPTNDELRLNGAQIAIRLPGDVGEPHIDGFHPINEEPCDTPDAILGIYLTDIGVPEDGALTVWPDARSVIADFARSHGGHPRRSDGDGLWRSIRDLRSKARPVLGPAGTAFLVHGATPHHNGLKATSGMRMAIFFRFYVPSHDSPERRVRDLLVSGGTDWGYLRRESEAVPARP